MNTQMLSKSGRIENRKILIREAVARIQNYMDCDVLQEAVDEMDISYILSAINYRYHDRADYEPYVKNLYDINIQTIKNLRDEINNILIENN